MQKHLPVNREDIESMYKYLIATLCEYGESGDVLSYVEILYRKAQQQLEKLDKNEVLKCMDSISIQNMGFDIRRKVAKEICQRLGTSKAPEVDWDKMEYFLNERDVTGLLIHELPVKHIVGMLKQNQSKWLKPSEQDYEEKINKMWNA